MLRKFTALGIGLAVAMVGSNALAEDAPSAAAASSSGGGMGGIQAAALVGFGLGKDPNAYGLGVGARVGLNVAGAVYVGGTFVYHLGKSTETPGGILGNVKTTVGIYYFGGEVGYDVNAGPVIIRPYVGLGLAAVHAEVCFGSVCGSGNSDSRLYVAPGAALLFPVTSSVFVGADARYVLVTGTGGGDASALGVFGTVGMKF